MVIYYQCTVRLEDIPWDHYVLGPLGKYCELTFTGEDRPGFSDQVIDLHLRIWVCRTNHNQRAW